MQKEEFIESSISKEYIYGLLASLNKTFPETDYDSMLVPDTISVGEEGTSLPGEEEPTFCITETSEIKTSYLWLRLENEYLSQWEKLCIRRETKGQGYSYLSTAKIHELVKHTVMMGNEVKKVAERQVKWNTAEITMEQNGPALAVKVTTDRKLPCGISGKCTSCELERDDVLFHCDFTLGLHCPQWPKKAEGKKS